MGLEEFKDLLGSEEFIKSVTITKTTAEELIESIYGVKIKIEGL